VIVLGAGLMGVLACEQAMAQAEGKTLAERRPLAARARRQLAMTLLLYIAFGAGLWLLAVLTHSLWAVLAAMVAFLAVRVARGSWRR
jgi:membrane protein YdbS with pleckstrin-like domain